MLIIWCHQNLINILSVTVGYLRSRSTILVTSSLFSLPIIPSSFLLSPAISSTFFLYYVSLSVFSWDSLCAISPNLTCEPNLCAHVESLITQLWAFSVNLKEIQKHFYLSFNRFFLTLRQHTLHFAQLFKYVSALIPVQETPGRQV